MPHSVVQIMKWILLACVLVALGAGVIINGLYMLVSPRAWYRLPHWFRASGGLSEEKYGSGWGAIQVRLVGATFLAVTAWVLYDVLSRHR
jgi:uncharacterized protein YjeT (DUF2065 family)